MTEEHIEPEVFTADYVGSPGQRTFYLQARWGGEVRTYLLEKDQVAVLAEKLREVLLMIDRKDTIQSSAPERDPALGLVEPINPEWRAGTMGLTYDEQEERVIVFVKRADGEEEPDEVEAFDVRFSLRRDQVRAFVLHAAAAVGEGRPLCQLCGLPMDPEGHQCPAVNGHRGDA